MQNKNNENYRYTEDGALLVRKYGVCRWGGFLPMLPNREMWYLCSGEDSDKYFGRMVLLGWFGWHKFQRGAWAAGLCYLLTCGCFGVFYFSDLLSMLTGDYAFKEVAYEQGAEGIERRVRRVYYKPLEDRRRGYFMLLLAVLVLAVALLFLYQPLGSFLVMWLSSVLSGGAAGEKLSGLLSAVW